MTEYLEEDLLKFAGIWASETDLTYLITNSPRPITIVPHHMKIASLELWTIKYKFNAVCSELDSSDTEVALTFSVENGEDGIVIIHAPLWRKFLYYLIASPCFFIQRLLNKQNMRVQDGISKN